ncbi:MAG: hypothetical protein K2X48_17835 [Chitinophagaceae bacterium]|nr:hypothetical protein [Chitinophagaceae bacterium]MBX9785152.1 hypothetical protein [Chitinophagaceae bacterium]
MAINKNHEFEDLNGVKCAVVEKNASQQRVDFLQSLLELNGFTVVVVPSPPPKAAPTPKPAEGEAAVPEPSTPNPTPSTFTVGVTDVRFNVTNALMGRMLKTKDGHIVTVDYWQQKETVSNDTIPYFSKDEYIHSWK